MITDVDGKPFVYVYDSPLEKGYAKIKVSRVKHNLVFKYQQRTLFNSLFFKYVYFKNDKTVIVEKLPTVLSKALNVILFPISLLYYGIDNFSEIVEDTKKSLNPHKYGSFTSDYIYGDKYLLLCSVE